MQEQLQKAFRQAENDLRHVLERRKAEVKSFYGHLTFADSQYGGSKGLLLKKIYLLAKLFIIVMIQVDVGEWNGQKHHSLFRSNFAVFGEYETKHQLEDMF